MQTCTRREFLRKAAITGACTAIGSPSGFGYSRPVHPKIRLAFIGLGNRGQCHLKQALLSSDIEITAICDSASESVRQTLSLITRAGRSAPIAYGGSDDAFLKLLAQDSIDGVIIATPWQWHVPIAIAAMEAGKYVGMEVSPAASLQEAWNLIDASEKTGSHCMMLENVCYRRDVLAVLNIVRQGMFGEMTYAQCGYQHSQHTTNCIGATYPTHGLGPVSHWFNINRGNRFVQLTSMATKSRGLYKYLLDSDDVGHTSAVVNFRLSDVVTTTLHCANGETAVIIHDTQSPRPYSPGFRVQGTHGTWMQDHSLISLNRSNLETPGWEPFGTYQEQYDHPSWKQLSQTIPASASIDSLVFRAFVDAIKTQSVPPIDVYDVALWRSINLLAEQSIAPGSTAVEIPDFTRGKWKTNQPIFGLPALV